jgi:hypothetical protein
MLKATPRTLLTLFYLSAAALVFLPVATAVGEEPTTEQKSADHVPVTPSPFVYGMRVWIDPATGTIRQPTKAERSAVAERASEKQLLNKSDDGLLVVYRKDGSRFVDLEGRFMHSLVLTRAADGTLTAHCLDGKHDSDEGSTADAEELPVR